MENLNLFDIFDLNVKINKRIITYNNLELEIIKEVDGVIYYRDNEGWSWYENKLRFKEKYKPLEYTKERRNKARKIARKNYDDLTKDLIKDYKRHEHILKFGGSDPFYHDGMGLYLKRNHIINRKSRLRNIHEMYGFKLPDIYFKETPIEYPMDYMANREWLEKEMEKVLDILEDYKPLLDIAREELNYKEHGDIYFDFNSLLRIANAYPNNNEPIIEFARGKYTVEKVLSIIEEIQSLILGFTERGNWVEGGMCI